MPISTDPVGRRYVVPAAYLVTEAKIAEFSRALGQPVRSGDGIAQAPPTFAAVVMARAWELLYADPELHLSLARTLHYDQAFTFVRPLAAGDEVGAELVVTKVRVRGATQFITVRVDLSVCDEPVASATSTLVHTAAQEVVA